MHEMNKTNDRARLRHGQKPTNVTTITKTTTLAGAATTMNDESKMRLPLLTARRSPLDRTSKLSSELDGDEYANGRIIEVNNFIRDGSLYNN